MFHWITLKLFRLGKGKTQSDLNEKMSLFYCCNSNDPITLVTAVQIFTIALIGAGIAAAVTIPVSISFLNPSCKCHLFIQCLNISGALMM